ncbi:MAG: transcriptional regulator [Bacteroidales bacterium]|nr:transcriptional regulator [Bacteroidales bacterium]
MRDFSIIQIFMREFSIIKQKILQYLDFKGISKYKFYQETGITNGILSQNNGISEDNLLRFLSVYKDISAEWLMRDEGSMLKTETDSVSSDETTPDTLNTSLNTLKGILEGHASDIDMLKNEVANIKKRLENG